MMNQNVTDIHKLTRRLDFITMQIKKYFIKLMYFDITNDIILNAKIRISLQRAIYY